MSYKEKKPKRKFFSDQTWRWGIALNIYFIQMSLNFPTNCDLLLQTKAWKNENLKQYNFCGFSDFSREVISFRFSPGIILNSLIIFQGSHFLWVGRHWILHFPQTLTVSYFCRVCPLPPPGKMASQTRVHSPRTPSQRYAKAFQPF